MNWSDAKYVLAAARAGSLNGAAKVLDVNATTVARRLEAFEKALGSRLFERIDGRLVLTAAGEIALRHLSDAERALRELDALGSIDHALPSGTVRVSTVGTLLGCYLMPRLVEFMHAWPAVRLELIADTAHADLLGREVDLALRMVRPETGSLAVKRLSQIAFATYCAKQEFETLREKSIDEWPWIGYEKRFEHLPEAHWRREHAPTARLVLCTTVGATTLNAVQAGLGVAMLPCYAAEAAGDLVRLTAPVPLRELWLVAEPNGRRLPAVNAVHAWMCAIFERDREVFLPN